MSAAEAIQFFQGEQTKVLDHLKHELAKLQTGRASSALVEHIHVEAYGSKQQLRNIATISIPEPKSIHITPWDKTMLPLIDKAIQQENIGLNPNSNGESIILNLPPLTEERRRDLTKVVKRFAEEAKVAIRQARQKAKDKLEAQDLPEDQLKGDENKLQEHVETANKEIDSMAKKKEEEIMTI